MQVQTRNSNCLQNLSDTTMQTYKPIKAHAASENCLFSTWRSTSLAKLKFHIHNDNTYDMQTKKYEPRILYRLTARQLHVSDKRQFVLSSNSPFASTGFV